ncbi:MAG: HAD-IB family hydrolase [Cellulomonadaceae bacterium]|nr:HAD-IB family hydrolase [Cellulomonadaceae bacterium]
MSKVAAFFDLDKTIIATSTSAAFTRPLYDGGLVTKGEVARTALAHAHYILTGADAENTERLRKQLSELATGWDVAKVKEIVADSTEAKIDPQVYKEAMQLIAEHHELGHDVVIISASVDELVEPIARLLGADHYVATKMSIEDGKYTGEISFYAYGEAKAEAIRDLAQEYDYDLAHSYAYSDSVTDTPMLDAVGYGTVVNPDRALRKLAVEHGWNQLTFANPITLRSSLEKHVAGIPDRVAAAREKIETIPEIVAGIPKRVSNVREVVREKTEAIPIVTKDQIEPKDRNNAKKSAAIAAAGIAVAGAAIAAASRQRDQREEKQARVRD